MIDDGQTSYQSEKTQKVSEIIVYNPSQQKRFFVDVTLKSSIAHYKLKKMTTIILRPFRLQNGILTAIWWHKTFSDIAFFSDRKGHFCKKINDVTQTIWALLKVLNYLIWFCLYFGCWKRIGVTKPFFAHNVTLCNSVTFKFWVPLEFSRRHGDLKPKRFDFFIHCKPFDRICPFHYQWLELFGLLEEIYLESSVAFSKCFSKFYKTNCVFWFFSFYRVVR